VSGRRIRPLPVWALGVGADAVRQAQGALISGGVESIRESVTRPSNYSLQTRLIFTLLHLHLRFCLVKPFIVNVNGELHLLHLNTPNKS
jgi:hypothetical protein